MKQWQLILICALLMLFAVPASAGSPLNSMSAAGIEGIPLIGLTATDNLLFFHSASPGTIEDTVPITGLPISVELVAIDVRPATGQLYGLGISPTIASAGQNNGYLFLIDPHTGAATQVGSAPFSTALADSTGYGFDFNPAVDRIRVVNISDQNLRVNPDTGALVGTDTNLDNPAGSEEVVGLAYNRNLPGYGLTTLYGIDYSNSLLVMQGGLDGNPSPNGGLITPVGPLGHTPLNSSIGFDIAGTALAFVSFLDSGTNRTDLFIVNLSTGAATLIGSIGTGSIPIRGLAVAPRWRIFSPIVLRNH
jgi:hypothetical protein